MNTPDHVPSAAAVGREKAIYKPDSIWACPRCALTWTGPLADGQFDCTFCCVPLRRVA